MKIEVETKFDMEQAVYYMVFDKAQKQKLPCPACLTKKKIKAQTGIGEVEVSCPNCRGAGTIDGKYTQAFEYAGPSPIGKIVIERYPNGKRKDTFGNSMFDKCDRTTYMVEATGTCGGRIYGEDTIWATEAEAIAAVEKKTAEENARLEKAQY